MGNICGKLKGGSKKCSTRNGSMFRYDYLSYSQNFDDGRREDNVEIFAPNVSIAKSPGEINDEKEV